MDVKIKQYVDGVYVEGYTDLAYIDITYKGKFKGQMVADANVFVLKNRIIITHIDLEKSGYLFSYEGNLDILKVAVGGLDKSIYFVPIERNSDEVQDIKSLIGKSYELYTALDKTNKNMKLLETSMMKKVGSDKIVITRK